MKKVALLIMIIGLSFPLSLLAQKQTQVKVINATANTIVVDGQTIKERRYKEQSVQVLNGYAIMDFYYYEGLNRKPSVKLIKKIDKNRVIIKNYDSEPETDLETQSNSTTPVETEVYTEEVITPVSNEAGGWWSEVTLVPKNSLDNFNIFVPTGPFKGLALAPGQMSQKSIIMKTGDILFPVYMVDESKGNQEGSGIKYSWALVSQIITEGQTVFEFLPENIMDANVGEEIRKTVVSKLDFDFIIFEGASKGTVVAAGRPEKLKLYVGWNIIPIQYKASNGLPTQAIVILLVNKKNKPLVAKRKEKEENIIRPDNLVITNFR